MHPTGKNVSLNDNGVIDKSSVAFYSLGYASIAYIGMIAIICITHMHDFLCNRATQYYRYKVMNRKNNIEGDCAYYMLSHPLELESF